QRLYGAACEARRRGLRTSRALDLQATCAERRRGALAALVGVLREADATAVERASQAASRLPAVDRCSDFAALTSEAEPGATRDPIVLARIESQHERLALARAELEAGHYARARELTQAVVEESEQLADDPLIAEALIARAAAELALGDYRATGATLHRSFTTAEVAGQDDLAADAAVRLVHLHGEREHDLARAETWAELAEAKLRRAGDDGVQRPRLLLYLGQTLAAAGRLQDAQPLLDQAMTLTERRRDRDPTSYVMALNASATLAMDKGALDVAEPLLRRSLALREANLGPEHPSVAVARHNLGRLLYERRDFSRAAAEFRRALEIREHSLGPEHPGTVQTLNGLGAALSDNGDREAGIEIFRRVLAIEERRRGVDHLDLFAPLNNLGQVAINAGELATAADYLERARALLERQGQGQSPDQALVLYNLGALRLAAGDPAEAVTLLERSLILRDQIYGPEHPEVGTSLALLSEAEFAAAIHDRATIHAERAITVLRKRPAGALELGRARLVLARLRWRDPRTRDEARTLAREALKDLTSEARDSEQLREVRLWLATH
ncbi:MAG TPA: tetratricopeptide repeat protein, partial [Nannocystis sp.]